LVSLGNRSEKTVRRDTDLEVAKAAEIHVDASRVTRS